MSEDSSNLINNLSNMLKNKEVPNNVQELLNSFINNSSNEDTPNNFSSDFDIDSILKMKEMLDAMNSNSNNESANLLLSLKPYLKDSKKEKVDKYIKILKISKLIDVFNPLGGDKKDNV